MPCTSSAELSFHVISITFGALISQGWTYFLFCNKFSQTGDCMLFDFKFHVLCVRHLYQFVILWIRKDEKAFFAIDHIFGWIFGLTALITAEIGGSCKGCSTVWFCEFLFVNFPTIKHHYGKLRSLYHDGITHESLDEV